MNNYPYPLLIAAFDTALPMSITDISKALSAKYSDIRGDIIWMVEAGLIASNQTSKSPGNRKYKLTAKGHCYALNCRCPFDDAIKLRVKFFAGEK